MQLDRTSCLMISLCALPLALGSVACGPTSAEASDEPAAATGGVAGTTNAEFGGGAGGASGGSGGLVFGTGATGGSASDGGQEKVPVRSLPGLTSMTFFERTGGSAPTAYTFQVNGPELTQRLPDPIGEAVFDIAGAPTEYYDVYYSDENGEFDQDGSYLTISGVFALSAPAGGGLNLAEIALNFSGKAPEFGNYVASFASHGDNKDDQSIGRCIDGDLQTETTLGNTIDSASRLRLTLGFLSSSGPPPPVK